MWWHAGLYIYCIICVWGCVYSMCIHLTLIDPISPSKPPDPFNTRTQARASSTSHLFHDILISCISYFISQGFRIYLSVLEVFQLSFRLFSFPFLSNFFPLISSIIDPCPLIPSDQLLLVYRLSLEAEPTGRKVYAGKCRSNQWLQGSVKK